MTPQQKIKAIVIATIARWHNTPLPAITEDSVDELYDAEDEDDVYEAKAEIREGEIETGLPCEYSRHYESKSVAARTPDGTWVGWTYWYGGGKHGEPEAIDWIEDAYDLSCVEEEKLVTVRTFTKAE